MKILSIKLKNYIGIFNGLGLNEIYIDFRKCKHKIIAIRGRNGSGKSSLFNAIHPLPDSNDKLVPGLPAEKLMEVLDGDTLYILRILHGINKNGNRETTKAYIKKVSFDGEEELNPNGNISTYRDILFAEFNLDPNFVALSQLSSEDRGIADKSPAERKKFVNSIINTLQVYNDIYKVLSKRSSIFKSMMNNLITKIDNIGDEEKLNITLTSLENRINNMLNDKDLLTEQLAANKSKISLIDPDGSIQNSYNLIYNNLVTINASIKESDDKIEICINKLPELKEFDDSKIMDYYNFLKSKIIEIETYITMEKNELNRLLLEREEEAKNIQTKTAKLLSLKSERNYTDINKAIKECKKNIDSYSSIINMIGIKDIFSISKDEFIIGLNTLKEIKEVIDVCKSFYEYHIIEKSIEYVKNNSYPDIDSVSNKILELDLENGMFTSKHQEYSLLSRVASKLSNRPSNCNIDSCLFIKDALDATKQEPEHNMKTLEANIKDNETRISELENIKTEYSKIIECINYIKTLIRNLNKNISIINKLPIGEVYLSNDNILKAILDNYDFKEIDTIYQYIDYANIIEEYKKQISLLSELESEYKVYESKNQIIEEITNNIDELNIRLNSFTKDIEYKGNLISKYNNELDIFRAKLLDCELLTTMISKKKELINKKSEEISKFNMIKANMVTIKECANNIMDIQNKLETLNKGISPIIADRDKIKHGLIVLKEYKEELEIYTAKYNKVEIIKKYSSPSKGIQTLFMELYMNKTISLTNELLSLLFDGEYVLGQFVINESEFRIPCIGSGLPNDDISSMSTSQICMISMILSFALLQQSSTKYNILKLDEIDGGLDTTNRLQFLTIIEKQMEILNTEQVFIISHNSEMNYDNCDIIQLKADENNTINGNFIYKY